MARIKRYQLADVVYLVSQRGHNRLPTFLDGEDYQVFVEAFKALADQHQCHIHAWVLIPDGYWLLLTPREGQAISQLMQTLGRLYVRYINRKYGRCGTLWSTRYRACVIEPESPYATAAERFIGATAYRNMIVSEGDTWPWQAPATVYYPNDTDDSVFAHLEATLASGLAFGSPSFLQQVTEQTAIRTQPRRRGRPPKLAALA